MKALSGLAGCLLASALLAGGQDSTDAAKKKEATIREFLAVTKADQLGTQMMDQMGSLLEQSGGHAFTEFWSHFKAKQRMDDLIDLIVPIYGKYFEQAELEELIRFNKTPLGQKVVDTTPKLMKECMEAGARWGEKVAKEALAEYTESLGNGDK